MSKSYIGRDIEDAVSIGIVDRELIPKTCLGKTNREILSALAKDMIRNSYGKESISISEESHEALCVLRRFNFEKIYNHQKLKVESAKLKRSYRILFQLLLDDLEENKEESHIWKDFLENKTEKYLSETSQVRFIVDYISGMTDSFFVRTLEKMIVPRQIEIVK